MRAEHARFALRATPSCASFRAHMYVPSNSHMYFSKHKKCNVSPLPTLPLLIPRLQLPDEKYRLALRVT